MISLSKVSKKFPEKLAVDNLSFEVGKGEVIGFLGPNGAGKTTTMRMITGFLKPTEGKIKVGDYTITEEDFRLFKEFKRQIGYLPENNPLYPEMKTYEYLEFISQIRQISHSRRIDEIAEVCDIKEVLKEPIGELSRGYRQRTGLAAALFSDPSILIMDEPTSGLDPNEQVKIWQLIKNLGQEKTIILSTHILAEVEKMCSRVIIIDKGKIVADSSMNKVTNLPKLFRKVTLE